jgi:ribosomal protein S27AE
VSEFEMPMVEDCPKCGWGQNTCKYRPPFDDSFDALQWTCGRCGYTWRTPTLEEKKTDTGFRVVGITYADGTNPDPTPIKRGPGRPRKGQ